VTYTVTTADNAGEGSVGQPYGNAFTNFLIPEDLTQFCYVRTIAGSAGAAYDTYPPGVSKVFNEVTDKRTFMDVCAEKYSVYNFMWMDDKIFIHPQLAVDATLEINYYRRLPALDAVYSVIPENYTIGLADADQPYLVLDATGTSLWFATADGVSLAFAIEAEATAYDAGSVTTAVYKGIEVPNWLRDSNERLLMWGALQHLGAYLFDDKMEIRYATKFKEAIESINREEKWRRASGGNVRINFQTAGLI
jgi:hypothetical protein